MKAEIGFVAGTQRLELVIVPTSNTEWTTLQEFARRLGIKIYEPERSLSIVEPEDV